MEQTLMSLVGEYSEVMQMVNDPEVDQETVIDTLEGLSGEIEIKANGYGAVIRGIEYEISSLKGKEEYLKGLVKQISDEQKRLQNHIDNMKDRLMAAMIATGTDETGIKTAEFEFKLRTAGGQQKLEKCGEVPDNFKKIIYEDDDAKIRDYLKDHEVEWARLLPRKKSLQIKGV